MSKLYNTYLKLKKTNEETIYLFKNGIFFIALDDDAYTLSKIFNFKLTNLTDTVVKCGFPVNSLSKYRTLLEHANFDVQIIESFSKKPNINLNNIQNNKQLQHLLKKLSNINPDNLSIKEVYSFLEDFSKQAKLIINNLGKEE